MATLLRSDWQSAVEDELKKHARNLQQAAEQATQGVQSVFNQPVQAPPAPDVQQIQQQLQSYAQQVAEPVVQFGQQAQPAVQQAQQGVVQFGQQATQAAQSAERELQDYVGQIQFGQPPDVPPTQRAAPVAATAGEQPPSDSAGPTVAAAPVQLGTGREAFIQTLGPLAARVSASSGIDPNVMIAIAANETGWGQSKNAREQNNLFSLQGPAGRASRWATYDSPEESFQAFVDLISTAPRYKQAWAVRNDPDRFVDELRRAGYVADEPGYPAQGWVDQVKGINKGLPPAPSATVGERAAGVVQQAGRIVSSGAALPHSEEPATATDNLGDKWKTQFGFKSIYTGSYRTGTPHRGIDIVPQKGGIGTPIEAFHPGTVSLIQRDSGGAGGLMVYVKDAEGLTHAYMHLQKTAEGLKVGDVINRGQLVAYMGESGTEGSPHLHYEVRKGLSGDPLDQLIDPRPFMIGRPGVPTTRAQPTDQQAASVTAPTAINVPAPPAKPPLIAGQNQPTIFGEQGRRPAFEVVQDVVGAGAREVGRIAQETEEFNRRRAEFEQQQDAAQAQRRQQNQPLSVPESIFEATRQTGREMSEAPGQLYGADVAAGQQVAETVVGQAKQAGWQPDAQTERITRSLLSTVTPTNAILSILTAGGPGFARMLTEGAVTMATSGVGQVTAQELAANAGLPEWAQVAAGLGGAVTGGVTGVLGTRGAIRAIESEAGQAALRARQPAELNLGLITGEAAEPPAATVAPQVTPPSGVPQPAAPEAPAAPPRPPDFPVTERFPNVPRPRGAAAPPETAPAGVQRLPNYPAGQIEQSFEDLARASREASPDGLAHVELNDLPDDVMPFNVNAPTGQGKVVKLNPGGMPNLDDLRALARATAHKSGFYVDQGDAAAPLVGTQNAEEFFTLNSVMSQRTGVPVQVAESIQTAGLVRKIARDSRAAGDAPEETRRKILEAIVDREQNPLSSKTLNNKYGSILKGYTTGEAPVSAGAKTSVFAGNYGSAEGRFFDPRVTNDVHNWRIMNVDAASIPELRLNKRTGEQEWFYDRPHEKIAANNDQAYRATEAVINELARESGMDGYSIQSGMWDGIRAMQNLDPPSYKLWQQGFFQRAIERAERRGVFGGKSTAPGQVNLAEGDIQRVMNSGSVQRALATWGEYLKDPLPPELGIETVSRTFPGKGRTAALRRPSNLQFREAERVIAESDAPVVHGMSQDVVDKLGYDADRGIFPWLESSHRVVQASPDEFIVHLPGGNEDTARYVAAQVGQAADSDAVRIHVPDYQSQDVVGVYARAEPEQIQALAGALDNMGLPAIVGTGKRSLQVPLAVANDRATINAVEDAALSVGVDPKTALWEYTGRTADVPRAEYGPTSERGAPAFAPTTAERRALLERGVGAVPEGGAAAAEPAFTAPEPAPTGGRLRRARGEVEPQLAAQLGGAALGGYAGAAATPEGSEPGDYARNIGLGALTGLAGGTAVGRSLRPPRAPALAREAPGGFRAPGAALGEDVLQARRNGGAGRPPQEPRRLGDVHSNRWLLNEADEGVAPLNEDEVMEHAQGIESRFEEVRVRREAVDELLNNPTQKPYRPSWAAGWTNEALVELARRNGVSAYEEAWDQRLGFDPGSGEMKYDVGQSGLRGTGRKESTPQELRAEQKLLQQEQADLEAAYEQLTTAPAGARFARRPEGGAARGELPFDVGSEEGAPHGPYATEGSGPSGVVAEDIVTRNGTEKKPSGLKTLWHEPGQVVGQTKGVTSRGIYDAEAAGVGPPSEATLRAMPNMDALLSKEVPLEVRQQIQKAVEDNPELLAAYQQGRISHSSLVDDLARKVGMSTKDWLKTDVGQGFSTPQLVALQAASVDAEHNVMDMAVEIIARGGVDELSPEEVAFSLTNLFDTTHLLSVARGARGTQGRSLNALKIRMSRTLARGIAGANERKAALKTAEDARRAATKATQLLNKTRDLEQEAKQAVNGVREAGLPKNIEDQVMDAYAELERYQAMSLHEKGDDFARLAKERAERAAARKARVRAAPEELLSALRAELAAERKIFAGRKNTWETMAFWDSKAAEIAAEKRARFRGGLYLEQHRKAANDAAKIANREAEVAWERASRLQEHRTDKAKALLEGIGGEAPSRELLKQFVEAAAHPDPMVAAKFLKGLHPQRSGFASVVNAARNANILRLAGMLSATATHVINLGGSALKAGLQIPEHALTVAYDIPRAAITGGERQAYMAELKPMLQGWWRTAPGADGKRLGMVASLPDALRILTTGVAPAEVADLSKIRPGFRSSDLPVVGYPLGKLPGRAAERVIDPSIEMPLRALQAEDQIMRGAAFGMHAERVATREAIREGFSGRARIGRANNIIANLEEYPELYREAYESAAYMVFQEKRTVAGMGGLPGRGTPGVLTEVGVSQVMPFRKTPINITAQGLGYSPLGILGVGEAIGTRGEIAAKVATGELPKARLGQQTLLAEQRAARMTIGSAILGAAYFWATQEDDQGKPKGALTAMYDEDEASTYPQGWRAWSFRTENPANGEIVYTPLQNFGHAGVPLAMAAILADAERRGKKVWSDEKEMGRAIAGVGRYALDTPFLQGLSDTVELFHDPGRAGTKFIEGLAGSYGPYSGMGRQIQRAFGVASRNPREGWLMLIDSLEANYPGLSGNVPEATTALGEARTPGATGFGALVGRYDIERDEPTLEALRIADVNVPRETRVLPTGGGYGVELTEAERDTLKRARGQAIIAEVAKERARPRTAASERTLRSASADSPQYRAALEDFNAAMQGAVTDAAKWANQDFEKQLGKAEIKRREKPTREVEERRLGTPSQPVGELNP